MVYWLFNFFNYIIFCLNIRIITRELVQIVSWSNFDTLWEHLNVVSYNVQLIIYLEIHSFMVITKEIENGLCTVHNFLIMHCHKPITIKQQIQA